MARSVMGVASKNMLRGTRRDSDGLMAVLIRKMSEPRQNLGLGLRVRTDFRLQITAARKSGRSLRV